jgi:hypothetical protein
VDLLSNFKSKINDLLKNLMIDIEDYKLRDELLNIIADKK